MKYILFLILFLPISYLGQSIDTIYFNMFPNKVHVIDLNLPVIKESTIPTNFIIKKYKLTYKKGKVKVIKPIDWTKIHNKIREDEVFQ
jgi:hypothetical protein